MILPKMRLFGGAALAALLPALSGANAQDSIPRPAFPVKLRAPENASWTWVRKGPGEKKDSSAEEEAATEKKPASTGALSVTKTGPIYSVRATVQNGPGWEQWILRRGEQTYRAIRYSGSQNWERLTSAHVGMDACQFDRSDFEDLDWIDEKNYVGVRSLDGIPVYCFELTTDRPLTRRETVNYNYAAASAAQARGETYGLRTVRAYLDAKTLLPLRFESGKDVFIYTMGAAPAEKQMPPDAVVADFRRFLAEREKLKR